jgi:hypothetical protein
MAKQTITSGKAPIVWSTVEDAFSKINANFTELYATVLGETIVTAGNFIIGQQYTIVSLGTTDFTLIGAPVVPGGTTVGSTFVATGVGTGSGTARPKYNNIDFESLDSNIIPNENDTYNLGSPIKRWASLYLSDTLSIGGAAITNQGLTIDLPSGTTVGGNLIIDPDKTFFKEISVNSQSSLVADQFNDSLNFQAGTAIDININSSADTIIIDNTGVTSLTAGTAMAISASTGAVTVSNAGVTAITAGLGMSRSTATGSVTIVNEGIVDVDAGLGISVGARDATTGKVIVTNTLPAGNAYRVFATAGEPNLTARSTADTITLIEGAGINITNTVASGSFTNRITLENTGVISLTAGNGVTLSGSTGNITISVGSGDLKGSLFADDSTMLVDGTGARIVGDVYTSVLRTSEARISLGDGAGSATAGAAIAIGQYAGNTNQSSTGLGIGFRAGFSNQGNSAVAIGVDAGYATQGTRAIAIGDQAGETSQGANAVAIGHKAGETSQTANSIILNASGSALNGAAAGFYVSPIRNDTSTGNVLTYNTTTREIIYSEVFEGDVTGSVFSDGSTMLIDGTEGKVVGPVESSTVTASSYIQTGVYVDLTAIAAALPTPAKGMIVFDDGTNQFRGYDGSSWVALN